MFSKENHKSQDRNDVDYLYRLDKPNPLTSIGEAVEVEGVGVGHVDVERSHNIVEHEEVRCTAEHPITKMGYAEA